MGIEKKIDQEKIVTHIVSSFEDWKFKRRKKEETWKDILNAYLTHIDEGKYQNYPWRSKVADTFVQETADTIASALRGALFPITEDYFRVHGLDDIGLVYADVMHDYLATLLDKSNFLGRIRPFLTQLTLFGNSCASIAWKVDKRIRKVRQRTVDENGNIAINIRDVTEVLYDNFSFETLDIFDVVFDPSKIYIDQTPIIRRVIKHLAEIKEMSDVYKNISQIENITISTGDNIESQKAQMATVFGLDYEPQKEGVELLEAYGDFIIDGEIFKDYIVTVANRKTLLRFEPNPYWGGRPIIWGTYDPLWFTPYAKGPIEPILGVYHLINTFTNQKADILNLIINGCFAYVDDGIIDPEKLILRPGGFIEVGALGNIQPLHPNANVTLAFTEIESLRRRGERSTGASTYELGAVPIGKRTAYEANIIKQGSATRFSDITRHIGNSVIEKTLNFYLDSVKQFKFGNGDIPDEALLGQYRVEYLGADLSAVKSYETQQFMMFTDIIGRNPVFSQAINPTEYINEWRRLLGIKNKNILKPTQAIEQTGQPPEQGQVAEQEAVKQPSGGMGLTNPDLAMLRARGIIP